MNSNIMSAGTHTHTHPTLNNDRYTQRHGWGYNTCQNYDRPTCTLSSPIYHSSLHLSTTGQVTPDQGQVSVNPGQQIYGQITRTTVDPNLMVALGNCSATTTFAHNFTTLLGQGWENVNKLKNCKNWSARKNIGLEWWICKGCVCVWRWGVVITVTFCGGKTTNDCYPNSQSIP